MGEYFENLLHATLAISTVLSAVAVVFGVVSWFEPNGSPVGDRGAKVMAIGGLILTILLGCAWGPLGISIE